MSEVQPIRVNTAERIKELYPQYMEMIRAFVSEGIIEVDEPTEVQTQWAHRAALGNAAVETSVAQLARASEQAFKQRYLEGMPMLIDFDSEPGGEHNGLEPSERFHFLRLFVKDFREFESKPRTQGLPDVHPVLTWYEAE